MSDKATVDKLYSLHSLVAERLIDLMEGEPSAQSISAAIKFLSENNITVDLKSHKSKQDGVKKKLHVIPRISPEELINDNTRHMGAS